MRRDMDKVVTERPRRGHHNKSKKYGGRVRYGTEDHYDNQAGGLIPASRRRNINHKEFSDLLGPLRRWLQKQVGRNWNAIWSEVCVVLDKRSLTGQHIINHIKWDVAIDGLEKLEDGFWY